MNKLLKIVLLFFFGFTSVHSQKYLKSWSMGFGGLYPRYISISENSISDNNNYGIQSFLNYKVSEHSDFRVDLKYIKLSSFYYLNSREIKNYVDLLTLGFDIFYSPYPCDLLSPYLFIGFGAEAFNSTDPISTDLDDTKFGYELILGIGAETQLSKNIFLYSEFSYVTSSSNKIDGNFSRNDNKGLFDSNGDTYFTAGVGIKFLLSKTEENEFCDRKPSGLSMVDSPIKINDFKLDTTKKYNNPQNIEKLKFWGTNFEFNKAKIRYESYPILDYVVKTMKQNPNIKIDILGHTDNIGTEEYNIKLSYKRAEAVRNYLLFHGISSSRISIYGLGETFPIASNSTPEGRAKNRRIEFKVIK